MMVTSRGVARTFYLVGQTVQRRVKLAEIFSVFNYFMRGVAIKHSHAQTTTRTRAISRRV